MQIREVLKLTAGSLVELDHRTGEPVEIVGHNAAVARGEVVSAGGNYGVRIQDLPSSCSIAGRAVWASQLVNTRQIMDFSRTH